MESQKEKHVIKEPPDGLSPEAQQRLQEFMTDYWQDIRDTLHSINLRVILWGPGLNVDTPIAKKRWEIRAKLRELEHIALFSEEIDAYHPPPDLAYELELVHAYLFKAVKQAQHSDFVVMLLDRETYGSIAELITVICSHPDIATKMYILVPKIYKDTFTYQGATELYEGGNGAVHWYTEDDVSKCNVLTIVVQRVTQRRLLLAQKKLLQKG